MKKQERMDSWIPRTQKTDNQNAVRDKQTILNPFIAKQKQLFTLLRRQKNKQTVYVWSGQSKRNKQNHLN